MKSFQSLCLVAALYSGLMTGAGAQTHQRPAAVPTIYYGASSRSGESLLSVPCSRRQVTPGRKPG